MKPKLLTIILFSILAFFMTVIPVYADTAGSSAVLVSTQPEKDKRPEVLKAYFTKYNSPLVPYAENFVEEADKNKLDWKLVASIAGVESYFGQQIPIFSYNGWGYGVYGNNVRRFSSWEDGIQVVSRALRSEYMDGWKATNVSEIGSIYAADPMWANKVSHFMTDIENFTEERTNPLLSISL